MIQTVIVPKFDQSVEESTIVKWHKQEGDAVCKGDILFEIETEKTTLEIESFFEGTLLKIIVAEDNTVPVMTPVAYIGDPGDAIPEAESALQPASPAEKTAPSSIPVSAPPKAETPASGVTIPEPVQPARSASDASSSARIVSPRARRLIRESAISAGPIPGTGPGGRVEEKDVQAYLEAKGYDSLQITPTAKDLARENDIDLLALDVPQGGEGITEEIIQQAIAEKPVPLSTMRQVIARRLTESFTTTPHFFTTVSVDMTDLLSWREQLKQEGKRLSVTDFILKAIASALMEFPSLNSSTDGLTVRRRSRVHLGLAVSISEGLVVPVIRDTQNLDLAEIHELAASLATRARDGKLAPAEMAGSTFTVSNMGMLNVENFTAIINPGESAILAVASVQAVPAVHDRKIEIRSMMKITLSADHRLVDGAMAAEFVNHIKSQLENLETWKGLCGC